ncbi:hypothetical protein [Sphingomonas sp.]|uniref:hypothetical protein n=1 Tax=Sphingomonas sp. TaxID=28214 RepID=UPI0025F906AD|nr:hypothetical protein [Sphingomonas sp.]
MPNGETHEMKFLIDGEAAEVRSWTFKHRRFHGGGFRALRFAPMRYFESGAPFGIAPQADVDLASSDAIGARVAKPVTCIQRPPN